MRAADRQSQTPMPCTPKMYYPKTDMSGKSLVSQTYVTFDYYRNVAICSGYEDS